MISVIIPVYNGEAYIKRCLDSLLSDKDEGLEVIAVNDGSRDASSAILHEYAERFPQLRVIDKENGGAAQARRTGMEQATGDYIGFVDIDDYVAPDWYRKMAEKVEETNADIVVCDYVEVCGDRTRSVKNAFAEHQTFPLEPDQTLSYLHRRTAYFPFPWNKIYRAELLRAVQFPSENFVGEDYNMQLQLLHNGARVEYLPMEGYYYVLTPASASRGGFGPGSVRAYRHFCEDYQWILQNRPNHQKEAAHYLMTEYMAIIIAMGRNKTYDKDMIRSIKKFIRGSLGGYLSATYVPLTMKASALSLSVSYRLLVAMYRLIKR